MCAGLGTNSFNPAAVTKPKAISAAPSAPAPKAAPAPAPAPAPKAASWSGLGTNSFNPAAVTKPKAISAAPSAPAPKAAPAPVAKITDPDLLKAVKTAGRSNTPKAGPVNPLLIQTTKNALAEQQRRDKLRAEYAAMEQAGKAEQARLAEAQRQAEALQAALVQAQAQKLAQAQLFAAEQQRQLLSQAQAQKDALLRQQEQQRADIAKQQAEQQRTIAAQRLATGAASASLRAINQKRVGSGPTAPITVGGAGSQRKRRNSGGTGAEGLRIGSSGQAPGAGLNLGG